MVKKLNPILVQKGLAEKDIIIFSPREFQRIFAVSGFAAQKFIHQHARKGFFNKLKNGFYRQNNEKFFMAEPEKALLDYLYFLTLNSGKINSRINITKLNKQKIKKWQKLFNNPKIDKFITELYAG